MDILNFLKKNKLNVVKKIRELYVLGGGGCINTWLESDPYDKDMILRCNSMLQLVECCNYSYDSVLDLGCGVQYLRNCIPLDKKYTGLDLYKHKEDTIQCDFNKKIFPINNSYDLVFMAGVLEYIYDKKWFLKEASYRANKYILLSYLFKEFVSVDFINIKWTTLMTQRELFDIMLNLKFKLTAMKPDAIHPHPNTTLYMLFERY